MSEKNWPHFTHAELKCKCGCGENKMDDVFMSKIENLRAAWGKPMKVSSAYRCQKYNSEVSSTGLTGPHTTGKAIDFAIAGDQAFHLVEAAIIHKFTGIGVSQKGDWDKRFIHIDLIVDTTRPRIWSY